MRTRGTRAARRARGARGTTRTGRRWSEAAGRWGGGDTEGRGRACWGSWAGGTGTLLACAGPWPGGRLVRQASRANGSRRMDPGLGWGFRRLHVAVDVAAQMEAGGARWCGPWPGLAWSASRARPSDPLLLLLIDRLLLLIDRLLAPNDTSISTVVDDNDGAAGRAMEAHRAWLACTRARGHTARRRCRLKCLVE